jgi:hypothetical protein
MAGGTTSMRSMRGSCLFGPGTPAAIQSASSRLPGRELHAALVGQGAGGLAEQEAAGGVLEIDAAAEGVPGEDDVVALVVVAAEGEAEPGLAGGGAVAGAAGAAEAGEEGLDLVAEVGLGLGGHAPDDDGHGGRAGPGAGADDGAAVRDGEGGALLEADDAGGLDGQLGPGGLPGEATAAALLDDEGLARVGAVEDEISREQDDPVPGGLEEGGEQEAHG